MTREETIYRLRNMAWLYGGVEEVKQNIEAIGMAIEALSKPNYESDNEVRLAVVDRNKDKVVLFDSFGEVEYYPKQVDRPHGEWVDEDGNKVPLNKDGYPLGSCYCNQCHEWLIGSDEYATKGNFCPNCGVRMKGDDSE